MKIRYKLSMLPLLAVIALGLTNPVHAAPTLYSRTDRPSYFPGDSGTIILTVRNEGSTTFSVKSINVTYSWKSFVNGRWDGNTTMTGLNDAITSAPPSPGSKDYSLGFTVPNDGRVGFGGATASITVGTDGGTGFKTVSLFVALPTYEPVGLANLLPLISTILLAVAVVMLALVFMAVRGPMMKKAPSA